MILSMGVEIFLVRALCTEGHTAIYQMPSMQMVMLITLFSSAHDQNRWSCISVAHLHSSIAWRMDRSITLASHNRHNVIIVSVIDFCFIIIIVIIIIIIITIIIIIIIIVSVFYEFYLRKVISIWTFIPITRIKAQNSLYVHKINNFKTSF
jgi:hypothetical protein